MDWYLIKTRNHKERQVEAIFRAKGIETYWPDDQTFAPRDRRSKLVGCYFFARLNTDTDQMLWARSAPGVDWVVARRDAPAVVPGDVIERFQQLLERAGDRDARNGPR